MALTALRARHVLAHGPAGPFWMEDGYVAWEGSTIRHVGTDHPGASETTDLGEVVLLPGLIDLDALADIDHLVLDSWHSPEHARSLIGSLDHWSHHRRDVLDPGQRETMREFALAQLALHGITTYMPIASEIHTSWAESCQELVATAELSRRIGLRGYLGPSYRSAVAAQAPDGSRVLHEEPELGDQGLAEALSFVRYARELDDPLVTPVLLPCRIETLTEELLRRTAEEARSRGLLVRLHSLQQRWERDLILQRHGVTPLQLIEQVGLLHDRLLIPHALFLDRHPDVAGTDHGDLATLAHAGVSVVHCPLTSFRYGQVLGTVRDYLEAGITMALGSDSFPPDLLRGMDVGLHAARAWHGHGAATLPQYLAMATTGGARALHRPDLGRIEVGATADLTAFGLDAFTDGVVEDPLRTLVLNSSARAARHTVVGGRTVVRDGTLPGMDLPGLRARAQELFGLLKQGYVDRDRAGRGLEDLFPPTFPRAGQGRTLAETVTKGDQW